MRWDLIWPTLSGPTNGALGSLGAKGCIRLADRIDADAIATELTSLPDDAWAAEDRNHYAHWDTRSFWAIGHRRGPVVRHTDDNRVLASAPSLRDAIRSQLELTPRRAVVTRLPPGGFIPIHGDSPLYFRDTIRLALCITSDPAVRILCGGYWYRMRPGEVWILDNLAPHAVYHRGRVPRIHAVLDCEPDAKLADRIRSGDAELGVRNRRDDANIAVRSAVRKSWYTAWQLARRARGLPVDD